MALANPALKDRAKLDKARKRASTAGSACGGIFSQPLRACDGIGGGGTLACLSHGR